MCRFGENWSNPGGLVMRKTLTGSIALVAFASVGAAGAADLPVKVPPMAPVAYSWTGCYVGISGGGAWGQNHPTGPNTSLEYAPTFNVNGFVGGGQAGCNWQFAGSWAVGVEGDFSWSNKAGAVLDSTLPPAGLGNGIFVTGMQEKYLWTARGRFGPTLDRGWVYLTGGVAGARVEGSVDATGWTGSPAFPATLAGVYTENQNRTGATIGVGLEYAAFLPNVSIKAEYLYVRFSNATYFSSNPVPGFPGFIPARNLSLDDNILRVGLNYKFGWGEPLVARY
jgi:outer membrane immunogenic protein